MPELRDRFRGCLLGLAVGDALGGRFEAQSAAHLRSRFPDVQSLFDSADSELWYTDDTQMTIGVAETLIANGSIIEADLCRAFVENYVPSRGYGRGTRAVLEAMEDGRDYRAIAERYFPGGSLGNGAAMRVAPVGLLFSNHSQRCWDEARLSALPTHLHPMGIEGAQVLALAVSLCVRMRSLDSGKFFDELQAFATTGEFRERLLLAKNVGGSADLTALGNGIEALDSVPTAIAAFTLHPNSFSEAIGHAIMLGGDTDTIAAMTGALSGAYLGLEAIPPSLVNSLESSPKGRDYLLTLADRLYDRHLAAAAET